LNNEYHVSFGNNVNYKQDIKPHQFQPTIPKQNQNQIDKLSYPPLLLLLLNWTIYISTSAHILPTAT